MGWGPGLHDSSDPTYSCVQGWRGGEGNIADNPRFVDFPAKDYHLTADSPCVDSGRNEEWMQAAVDLAGNPRVWRGPGSSAGAIVDLGAYEYDSFVLRVLARVGVTDSTVELI